MKKFLTTLLLSSLAAMQFTQADTVIISANPLEDAFVRISQVGGDQNNPLLQISTCRGTPAEFHDCSSIGKRTAYSLSDLRKQRLLLSAEEGGVALLDAVVVGGSVLSGSLVGGGAGIGTALVLGTAAGAQALAAVGIYSVSTIAVSTATAITGAVAAGTAAVITDVKKVNPMIQDREAASLIKVMSGNTTVQSIHDLETELKAALDF
jgi:hypothetical protein